jgi:hypothetical protein
MHGNGMVDSLFVKEKTLLSDGEIGFSSQFWEKRGKAYEKKSNFRI